MSRLRRVALTVAAALTPGLPQALGRRRRIALALAAPFVVLVVLLAWWTRTEGLLGTALDPGLVRRIGVTLAALGVVAAVSTVEATRHLWRSRWVAVAAVVPLGAGGVGLAYALDHSRVVDTVFAGGAVAAEPSAEAAADATGTSSTSPPPVTATVGSSSTTVDPRRTGRWNILLIGGDGEEGRSGVRTDSLMVVSVGRADGDVALVSIPRNLEHLPLPVGSPLRDRYPTGWPDLANSLYEHVLAHPEDGDGTAQAPEHAVTGAVAEALGIRIDNYLKVDMAGFIQVVDALGGVDVTLSKAIPGPGPIYGAKHLARDWYGPGPIHLDGSDALYYSRSREGDSDYARMARQRCLLAAAARQVSPARLLSQYRTLLDVMDRTVRSDLSPSQARDLLDLFGRTDTAAIRSLGLVPPLVDTGRPDYAAIRRLVHDALEPPAATPGTTTETTAPTASTTGPTTTAIAVLTESSSC